MRGITERILVGSLILLCVILVGFSLFMIIKSVGKMNLNRHADRVASSELTQNLSDAAGTSQSGSEENTADAEGSETAAQPTVELQEGQIFHNGEIWQYNEDIMTF